MIQSRRKPRLVPGLPAANPQPARRRDTRGGAPLALSREPYWELQVKGRLSRIRFFFFLIFY